MRKEQRPLSYRMAHAADIPVIARLAADTFIRTFGHLYHPDDLASHLASHCSEAFFRRAIAEQGEYAVLPLACMGEDIAAYAKLGKLELPVPDPVTPSCELHRLYVAEPHQGKGIGRMLLEYCLNLPEIRQMAGVYLGVWEHNLRAQALYHAYGFELVGEHRYYVGRHADRDLILLRKR